MEAYLMQKGRTEFFGYKSGSVYKVTEGEKEYIYFVNILDPNDIYVVKHPSGLGGPKNVTLPENVARFHEINIGKKNKKTEETERQTTEGISERRYRILGIEKEEMAYLRTNLGEIFGIKREFTGTWTYTYVVDSERGKRKFTIKIDKKNGEKKYGLEKYSKTNDKRKNQIVTGR